MLQRVHVPHPVEVPYDATAIEGGGHCNTVLLGCRDIRHGIEVPIERGIVNGIVAPITIFFHPEYRNNLFLEM